MLPGVEQFTEERLAALEVPVEAAPCHPELFGEGLDADCVRAPGGERLQTGVDPRVAMGPGMGGHRGSIAGSAGSNTQRSRLTAHILWATMAKPSQRSAAYVRSVPQSDLTAAARIRNAALARFAEAGPQATSIRDIAEAAGTSPGLVQHHFGTKAKLRDAVNEYVTGIVQDAFAELSDDGEADPIQAAGDRITEFVAANPTALRYVGRALVEDDPAARRVFAAFVSVIQTNMQRLAKQRSLHSDLDIEWAALHLVIFNIATLLFETTLDDQLGAPFFSPEQLRRWNVATTELYRRGMFR